MTLALLAFSAGAAVVFHTSLLRALAGVLITEEPTVASAQAVLLLGGETQFDEAANLHKRGAVFFLQFPESHGRLQRMGILPPAEHLARRELLKRGIPEDHVMLVSKHPVEKTQIGRHLCEWLGEHPGTHINIVCDRLSSRKWQLLISRSAGP